MNASQQDALALAASIAAGELSAVEALEASIAVARTRNPRINAVCNPAFDVGRERAKALDDSLSKMPAEARLALLEQRPFLGVPSLVKDLNTAVSDIPSTMGSRLFGRLASPHDAEMVVRLRRAGMIFFGRSTSPEMGISPSTEALAYGGPTRNPWQNDYSPGGSSGGAAAAVASGMVRIAHASDGAGSIRIPASACGLVGLKPSRGLNPMGPNVGESWGGLAAEHVVSMSTRDTAAALDMTAGADLGAPYPAPARPPAPSSYRKVADEALAHALDGRSQQPARIAVMATTLEGQSIDAEVAATVTAAAAALAELGHHLNEDRPRASTEAIIRPMALVMACGTAMVVDHFLAGRGRDLGDDELEPITRSAVETGRKLGGVEYMKLIGSLHRQTREIAAFFDPEHNGYDYLLMPVLAEPPAQLGRFEMKRERDYMDYRLGPTGLIAYSPFTPIGNITGQPAIAVPFGRSRRGLPIGIQILGRLGDDAGVLRLAAEIEAIRPWLAALEAVRCADRVPG